MDLRYTSEDTKNKMMKNFPSAAFLFILITGFFQLVPASFADMVDAAACSAAGGISVAGVGSSCPSTRPTNIGDTPATTSVPAGKCCISSDLMPYPDNESCTAAGFSPRALGPSCPSGEAFKGAVVSPVGNCCQSTAPAATTSPATGFKYQPLEPIPGAKDASSFPEYIQAIYKFGLWTVGLAALLMLTVGGFMYVTSAGNTSLIGNAKGIIQDSIIGIILALAAYFILNIINPDFVHVNLNSFSGVGGSVLPTTGTSSGTTTGPLTTCTDPDAYKAQVTSGGGVCTGITCDKTCPFSADVSSGINAAAAAAGVDARVVKALICRESSGNPNAQNPVGGVMSCGLMQVNYNEVAGNTSCSGPVKNLFNPSVNVTEGIRVLKGQLARATTYKSTYGPSGVSIEQMAFAAYNCCANGDNPNALSLSCTHSDGWGLIPKWMCPIAPGLGAYNMCDVKNYACTVSACISQY